MYCRTCGNKVNDNAEVCVKCGCKPLSGKNYCQDCGTKTTAQQVMCTKCRATLKSTATKSGQNQADRGKLILGKALIGIGIVWLALTIFGFLMGFITKEFIYDFIYDPGYFFTNDIGHGVMSLTIAVAFMLIGKRLNRK